MVFFRLLQKNYYMMLPTNLWLLHPPGNAPLAHNYTNTLCFGCAAT